MTARAASTALPTSKTLDALIAGHFADPFSVLGPHPDAKRDALIVRVFQPAARDVTLRRGLDAARAQNSLTLERQVLTALSRTI